MRKLALLAPAIALLAVVPSAGAQTAPPPLDVAGLLPDDAPTFAGRESVEYTDDVFVDLEDGVSESDIAQVASEAGITLERASDESEVDKIEVAHVLDPSRIPIIIDVLSRDRRVEGVERGTKLYASFVPNDPLYPSKQWHLKKVGAESSWDMACGMGVTVAVVDTGVACYDKGPFSKGSDLAGTRCTAGWNFVDNSPNASDDHGHGTHVAGTIAQTTNNQKGVAGLAFCATLMPVKVLNKSGWGTNAAVAQGIRWAADHGAQVINLSLGGPSPSKILERAIHHARDKGVIVIAAAGNSGRSVGYPAAYPEVVAVSATDSNDNIAWFSSRGPEIDLAAPGVAVTQQTICDGGRNKCEIFGTFNGTSMASPHVSGAAAVLEGLGVTDPDAIEAALKASAAPKNDAKLYGAGRLDVAAAANRVWYTHLAWRVAAFAGLLFAIGRVLKRRGARMTRTPGMALGALFGGFGLLPFAPLLGLPVLAGGMRSVVELAMRPLGEWDLVFCGGWHKFMPLANAAPSIALAALLFGAKRLRPFVGGFALGSAALLVQMAISGDTLFVLGSFAMRAFAAVNAAVCVFVARGALEES
jgi:serine protease